MELLRANFGLGTGRSFSSSTSVTILDSGEMWNSWKDFRQLVVIELASFLLGFGNGSLGVSLSLFFSTLDCTFRFAVVNALVILRELFKL